MDNYIVYVQTDGEGNIISINSSAFLSDTDGWTQIDEGIGDKYHHAQGNYFDKPIRDMYGVAQYELIGRKVIERTEKEMLAARPIIAKVPTLAERLTAVETELIAANTRIAAVELKTVADVITR